jgi:hypothetical protein
MPREFAERLITRYEASANVGVAVQHFRHVSTEDGLQGHPGPVLNIQLRRRGGSE